MIMNTELHFSMNTRRELLATLNSIIDKIEAGYAMFGPDFYSSEEYIRLRSYQDAILALYK